MRLKMFVVILAMLISLSFSARVNEQRGKSTTNSIAPTTFLGLDWKW